MKHLLRALFLSACMVCIVTARAQNPPANPSDPAALMEANEEEAFSGVSRIFWSSLAYSTKLKNGYPPALRNLGPSDHPDSNAINPIDPELARGVKSGYSFTYTPGKITRGMVLTFTVQADPIEPGKTGRKHFYVDESGYIRRGASAKAAANEGLALAALRALDSACIAYAALYKSGFPSTLSQLGPGDKPNADAAGLIDRELAYGAMAGYSFSYSPGPVAGTMVTTFAVQADPITPEEPGQNHFYMDQSGAIWANQTAAAGPANSLVKPWGDRPPGWNPGPTSASGSEVSAPAGPVRIPVAPGVQEAKILNKVLPVYPPLARQARISGTVQLRALISKEGTIEELEVISGPPLLIQSAITAVQQWRYQRTLLLGEPVEVETFIDVIFTLGVNPPPSASPGKPQSLR